MITAFRQVIAKEGAGALLTGFGPTALGYALQGAFKFGGYEFWKKQAVDYVGFENAQNNRQLIYLGASAIAEFFADILWFVVDTLGLKIVVPWRSPVLNQNGGVKYDLVLRILFRG